MLIQRWIHWRPSIWLFLTVHGVLAATVSYFLRFDWWWSLIQIVFPLCIFWFFQQDIPSWVYLIALAFFTLLFWSNYQTQVPYYPSKASLTTPILKLLPNGSEFKFVDLGSGLGGLLFDLARAQPQGRYVGIEYAPLPWLISRIRCWMKSVKVELVWGNFFELDLVQFDVVFCYLSPAAMPSVWERVQSTMKPGALFLSYEFIVPEVEPHLRIEVEQDGPLLFGWYVGRNNKK